MARIISASIDLTKIDKSKIVTTDKNGQPFSNGAKYMNLQITVNDELNKYDQDCGISINQSKEERESGQPKVYIGNGKTVWSSEQQAQPRTAQQPVQTPQAPNLASGGVDFVDDIEDSLPF